MNNLIDNKDVIVNKFILEPKEETGFHLHKLNYVIIPITDGVLKLVNKNNKTSIANLKSGVPYYRKAGIQHNVINNGKSKVIFIELEIK